MKLQNKETKKIGKLVIKVVTPDTDYTYESPESMWKEWEKSRDPLIEDKKAREIIRSWAKFNDFESFAYNKSDDCITPIGFSTTVSMSFRSWDILKNLRENQFYSTEELCGKDE